VTLKSGLEVTQDHSN